MSKSNRGLRTPGRASPNTPSSAVWRRSQLAHQSNKDLAQSLNLDGLTVSNQTKRQTAFQRNMNNQKSNERTRVQQSVVESTIQTTVNMSRIGAQKLDRSQSEKAEENKQISKVLKSVISNKHQVVESQKQYEARCEAEI